MVLGKGKILAFKFGAGNYMKRPFDLRTIFGLILTVIWLCIAVGLAYWKRDKLEGMELNAIGDFLAGVFAPLGFLWLVIGYFQQGEELQQNTEALKLQADELRNSVAEQQAVAEATKRQVELIERDQKERQDQETRKHQPALRYIRPTFGATRGDIQQVFLEVENLGFAITSVEISCTDVSVFKGPSYLPHINNGETVRIGFEFMRGDYQYSFHIDFQYVDGIGGIGKSTLYVMAENLRFDVVYRFQDMRDLRA